MIRATRNIIGPPIAYFENHKASLEDGLEVGDSNLDSYLQLGSLLSSLNKAW